MLNIKVMFNLVVVTVFIVLLSSVAVASSNEKIVFLGDSLTAFADWNELFSNGNIINQGVGGDTSRDIYNRLGAVINVAPKKTSRDIYNRLGAVINVAPKKIFIMAGINDIIKGKSVEDLILTYNKILNVLINRLPNVEIYVMSILPVNFDGEPTDIYMKYSLYINTNVIAANEKLKQTVVQYKDKYKVKYLDIYGAFVYAGTIKLNPLFTYDGIHLTREGYVNWKQQIKRYVY
ncbi:MAG: hypothetical protein HQK96_02390 [Nitrospirae bacterium]|nr:hypothetical protein [Nitrospirota bacterium]